MLNTILKNKKIHFVDVGASGGAHKRWKKLEGNLRTFLFEPDVRSYEKLETSHSDGVSLYNCALSDNNGEADFYLCKDPQKSSSLQPNFDCLQMFHNPERYHVIGKEKYKSYSLDFLLKSEKEGDIDFIKLDTQGSELSILHGASETLDNVIGLEVEVEFVKLYEEQSLFSDIDQFLKSKNFQLIDLSRYHWNRNEHKVGIEKGQLIFSDALYFKTPEVLIEDDNTTPEMIIKALVLYVLYGYIDMALSLLKQAKAKNVISDNEYIQCNQYILKSRRRSLIPNFKGKILIYKLLNKVASYFEPKGPFNGCDPTLGNKS